MNTKFFNENSHLSEEAIALYVDALKLGKVRQVPDEIREHISECTECQISVDQVFALLEDEEYESEERHPFFRSRLNSVGKRTAFLYKIAATVLVVIGIATAFYLSRDRRDEHTEKFFTQDTTNILKMGDTLMSPKDNQLLTENYKVLPYLDDLVNSQFRSSVIEIKSPAINEEVEKNITFRWTYEVRKKLVLKILNNKGTEVYSAEAEKNEYVFKETLNPGLYYWKLEYREEMLFVGKFRVK